MWGYNRDGQLGDGTIYDSFVPIKIMENIRCSKTVEYSHDVLEAVSYLSTQQTLISRSLDESITKCYENLLLNKEYIFCVFKSEEDEELLTSDNLLYIQQAVADEEGKLTFTYKLSENDANVVEKISSYGKFDTGVIIGVSGDVNGDDKLNLQDSALLRRYLAGWNVTINESAADVNGDGKLSLPDSATLRRYLAGWNVELK